MSLVQQTIEVGAPLHTVYEQICVVENYPRFMTGVEQVTPIGSGKTHWIMDLDGTRREFDAQITELSVDERVSWATTEGPRLSETITLRPVGETRTQVVAQLDADIAFLMPDDRHGQETLNRRLKHDLTTLKGLVEGGALTGASSKQLSGRAGVSLASPASVARRIKRSAGSGTAPMGGRTDRMDGWGDGMINEEDRGSAHDM